MSIQYSPLVSILWVFNNVGNYLTSHLAYMEVVPQRTFVVTK